MPASEKPTPEAAFGAVGPKAYERSAESSWRQKDDLQKLDASASEVARVREHVSMTTAIVQRAAGNIVSPVVHHADDRGAHRALPR